MSYLRDLINENKTNRNHSNEQKIQISMNVNFISLMILEKFVLFLCGVITKKLDQVIKQMILLKDFLILS